MNTSSRLPGWTAGWILAVRMASSCIACCIFHIRSIPFNCSDRALRVTDAKVGSKVKIFVFRHVCFVSRIWCQKSSPGSLTFSHLGNRAKISHIYEPKAKFIPVTEPTGSTGLVWKALRECGWSANNQLRRRWRKCWGRNMSKCAITTATAPYL